MKFSDGQSEFLRVFNFTIIGYSQNSRKLDAHQKLVFCSSLTCVEASIVVTRCHVLACKVEDSMENLLDVVAERDVACSELETGESCEPGKRWVYNELGIGYWRKCKPHIVPLHMNKSFRSSMQFSGPWQHPYIRLRREKFMNLRNRKLHGLRNKQVAYSYKLPDVKLELDVSEFTSPMMSKLKKHSDEQ